MSRIRVLALFLAWLCASGALLDFEQAFAWTRMFVSYSRTCSLTDAAVQTFDPGRPCPICRAVQRAKDAEHEQHVPAAPVRTLERILMAYEEADPVVIAPQGNEWPETTAAITAAPIRNVPVPPPRAA